MEENTSIVTSLNLIDFDEWINIPKPLVQALMVFKQCFVEQTRKSEDYSKEFENLTNKVNLRLKMLNDIQANTNEAIRKQQDTILKKVKERCDVLANDLSLFKNNFSEENAAEKKNISEILREMREKLGKFGKVISGTLTAGEINQIVNEKCLNIQISITNEIREQHIRPVTEKIANEVKLNSE